MSCVNVSLRLFGAMREFGPEREPSVSVPRSGSLGQLCAVLANSLATRERDVARLQAMLEDCAFVVDEEIVLENYQFAPGTVVSVLPPVCGG